MSEEAQVAADEPQVSGVESQVTADAPSSEPAATEPASQNTGKPAGYAPIDETTANPQQVKDRLDYLYGQVKTSDREKREMRGLLQQQSEALAWLSQGQQAVVDHLQTRSYADTETVLKQQMQDAWNKKDERAYIEAQNKLMDVQVEKKVSEKTRPQPQQMNGQQQYRSAAEVANQAVHTGELSPDEYRSTETWQNERNQSGQLVRPWAFDSDPAHQQALFEARAVLANPRYASLSYEQKLQEVDRRMGVQKPTVGQNVMGANLTKGTKSVKLELSAEQRQMALRLKPRGKSDTDALESYRKQLEKINQKTGGRK